PRVTARAHNGLLDMLEGDDHISAGSCREDDPALRGPDDAPLDADPRDRHRRPLAARRSEDIGQTMVGGLAGDEVGELTQPLMERATLLLRLEVLEEPHEPGVRRSLRLLPMSFHGRSMSWRSHRWHRMEADEYRWHYPQTTG